MPPRSRRENGEPLVVRAAVERERRVSQVTSYGYLARRGPKRHVTVTPRPLRWWQYDAARPWVLVVTVLAVAAWLAFLGWRDGARAAHRPAGRRRATAAAGGRAAAGSACGTWTPTGSPTRRSPCGCATRPPSPTRSAVPSPGFSPRKPRAFARKSPAGWGQAVVRRAPSGPASSTGAAGVRSRTAASPAS